MSNVRSKWSRSWEASFTWDLFRNLQMLVWQFFQLIGPSSFSTWNIDSSSLISVRIPRIYGNSKSHWKLCSRTDFTIVILQNQLVCLAPLKKDQTIHPTDDLYAVEVAVYVLILLCLLYAFPFYSFFSIYLPVNREWVHFMKWNQACLLCSINEWGWCKVLSLIARLILVS